MPERLRDAAQPHARTTVAGVANGNGIPAGGKNSGQEQAGVTLISRIEQLVRENRLELPALPQVAARINQLLEDPNSSLGQVADQVEQEPAIAARVLQLANSAFYRGLSEIKTVPDAVGRIGTRMVQTVTMAAASRELATSLRGPVRPALFEMLWEHSLAVGSAAREIARASKAQGDSELAFTCGLLHDIGKLVLLRAVDRVAEETGVELSESLTIEVLNRFHADVGAKALRVWQVPEPIPSVAQHHHEPPAHSHRVLTIVAAANLLCRRLGMALTAYFSSEDAQLKAWAREVGLSDIALASVEVSVEDLREQIRGAL